LRISRHQIDADVEWLLYPEAAYRRQLKRRVKSIVLIFVSVIGTAFFFWHESRTIESFSVSQRIKQATGITVTVAKKSVGVGILEFSGVSFGGAAGGSASSILAKVNLNPFSGRLGRPEEVTLQDFTVHLTPSIFAGSNSLDSVSNDPKVGRDAGGIPARIVLRNGNLHFTFAPGQPMLSFMGVTGKVRNHGRLLDAQVSELRIDNELVDEGLALKVIRETSGATRLEVSKAGRDISRWWIRALVGSGLKYAKVQFDVHSASATLAKYLEPYVVEASRLRLNGRGTVRVVPGSRDKMEIEIESHARDLSVLAPSLSRRSIDLPPLHAVAKGVIDASTRTIQVPNWLIAATVPTSDRRRSPNFVRITGQAFRSSDQSWKASMDLPATECRDLLAILPRAVLEDVVDIRLRGRVDFKAEASMSKNGMELVRFEPGSHGINCDVEAVPERFAKERLRYSQHLSPTADGRLLLGSESRNRTASYVDLDQIPEFVRRVFIHAEDRRFFQHQGFDLEGIRHAIRENFADGRFRFGGSTISQQLVKNLFFSGERTISRKLREAVMTWYVERYLNKHRILELYLNIVEFGPGVYGLQQAARFYFNKSAEQLSLREATFLTYLLPAPTKRFQQVCQETKRPMIDRTISERIHQLEKAQWVTSDQAFRGKTELLQFHRGSAIQRQCEMLSSGRFVARGAAASSRPF
jgi:hypothetical protein